VLNSGTMSPQRTKGRANMTRDIRVPVKLDVPFWYTCNRSQNPENQKKKTKIKAAALHTFKKCFDIFEDIVNPAVQGDIKVFIGLLNVVYPLGLKVARI
jgi:hypothetical protein